MKKSNNSDKELDCRISEMIRNESPAPCTDEWFTPKTLNRLPRRRPRIVSLPELIGFLIVLVVSVTVIVHELKIVLNLPEPTTFDPALLVGAFAMLVCATLYISIPILRKC